MAPKADINKAGWEQSDFPILCETCLGANPFVRMSKQEYGRSCGTCARPFTVFRWNPGAGARFKTTVICQTCAKVKNVCQTCLLDLTYALPTHVRDTALGVQGGAPNSDINREYYAQNMEASLGAAQSGLDVGKAGSAGREMLKTLARQDPYYKRNRPHLCSFYVKGECARGDDCPYRHEMPRDKDDELSKQNIKDRYHGTNDPVAKRILATHAASQGLAPPEDTTITSLFLSALPATATEPSIRAALHPTLADPAAVRSVVHVAKTRCAFVNFRTRAAAEAAANAWAAGLEIGGERVGVRWGRSRPAQGAASGSGGGGGAAQAVQA